MKSLTVLICTHDRAALLGKTLASLNAAARPAGWRIDILVAANACHDGTHALLDDYIGQAGQRGWLPLAWFGEVTPGKSHALNAAIPRLGGDLVTMVDDDHRVDARYLIEVCRCADVQPAFDLFCGRILPDWDGSEPAWVHDRGPYRIYPLPVPRFDQGEAPGELLPDRAVPGGGNLFLRTPWLQKVGPFDTAMGPTGHDLGGAEDLDWVLRALGMGARLYYEPAVVQHHYVDAERLALSYLMKKAYKRTASTVRLDAGGSHGVPRYVFRKLLEYAALSLTALSAARRRFYLVRLAAATGELAGHLRPARSPH